MMLKQIINVRQANTMISLKIGSFRGLGGPRRSRWPRLHAKVAISQTWMPRASTSEGTARHKNIAPRAPCRIPRRIVSSRQGRAASRFFEFIRWLGAHLSLSKTTKRWHQPWPTEYQQILNQVSYLRNTQHQSQYLRYLGRTRRPRLKAVHRPVCRRLPMVLSSPLNQPPKT